jgi:hypothetical protein
MDQLPTIMTAIDGYFDLMYKSDDNRFPEVFHDACVIHGLREEKLMVWPASEFREIMRGRMSPAAMSSPRNQEVLCLQRTAPDLVAAKLRVRIGQTCFVDHLIFHCIDGRLDDAQQ